MISFVFLTSDIYGSSDHSPRLTPVTQTIREKVVILPASYPSETAIGTSEVSYLTFALRDIFPPPLPPWR